MSFANIDLEAQKGDQSNGITGKGSNGPKDGAVGELEAIIGKTSKQLHLFGQLVTQLDNQRKQVGTRRDCRQLRANIDDLISKLNDLDNAINLLISNVSGIINKSQSNHQAPQNSLDVTKKHSIIKERLLEEYSGLHSRFQNSVMVYEERATHYQLKEEHTIETYNPATEETPLLNGEEDSSQSQAQIQQQIDQQKAIEETELQFQVLLTEEREREINRVTKGITEVNSIFKDLGVLVQQQGEQLDTIEDNIFQYQGDTQQASRELVKAHEYQKQKGKWSCIILVSLCIIVLIIVLVVVS